MKTIFIQFLKDNNCYDQYMANVDVPFERIMLKYSYKDYIVGTFIWSDTPKDEGIGFWDDINNKWNKRTKEIEKDVLK
ncbi:MAG: hypothetical protein GY861_12950 [bacterium]|nr:hypothetical protein [bacterium]